VKLLIDTHAFIWWLAESPRLSITAQLAIRATENAIYVSVATAWEIAIKVGQGKLPEAAEIMAEFEAAIANEGFALLPITVPHVRAAGAIQSTNRDPFDRLLVAQALIEGMTLVSIDGKISNRGVPVIWSSAIEGA
jgi:PIN domain nuclease of toxin-antitoxin system